MSDVNDQSATRVGDAERSRALDRLGEHFANGYLTAPEFEERTGHAAVARTRGDIEALFADLPSISEQAPLEPLHEDVSVELDRMLNRKRRLDAALGGLWSVTMVVFFLGLFVFKWSLFWVVFPIAGIATAGLYSFYGISDEDDEVLEEIKEDIDRGRAERLRIAYQRRKELGQ